MSRPASDAPVPGNYKNQLKGNLDYIASAPLANCMITMAIVVRDAREDMTKNHVNWFGPDGQCIFTNSRDAAAATGAAVDRGGWTDPGQRAKIVKYAYDDGREVPIAVIRAMSNRYGSVPPNVRVWEAYDNNKRLTIQQVALRVSQPALFDRLRRWAHGEFDQTVTFMIGHRCQLGNLGCIQGAHLTLVMGSANQSQRNCIAAKLKPCEACNFFPAITECYCTKHIANTAMADNHVALCITYPPTPSQANPVPPPAVQQMPQGVPQAQHDDVVREREVLRKDVGDLQGRVNESMQIARLAKTRADDYERQYKDLEAAYNQLNIRYNRLMSGIR